MATGLEVLGAASTLISIIGFSAQVFDGCVKGFVLLTNANNLGRDADILRSMLEWEQFRLEQWAEKAGLQDPAKADMLLDWKLIGETLQHIRNLVGDTEVLKMKYGLVLVEDVANEDGKEVGDGKEEKVSKSRFKRLFGQNAKSSTAAARVIQSQSSVPKKLWWAAVDKSNFQTLIKDISHFVNNLHASLNLTLQAQMQKQIETLLQTGTQNYRYVEDLDVLRELAAQLRREGPPSYGESHAAEIQEEVERGFARELFEAVQGGRVEEVRGLLDRGVGVQVEDRVGWPPLVRAAEHGQVECMELLLSRGADPTIGTIGNRLPLHFAAEFGHLPIVKLLLQQPIVDPSSKDFTGHTALFKAANHGRTAIVEHLLQQPNIDPNTTTTDGFTPLLTALFENHLPIVSLLLASPSIDPNLAETTYQQTPLWMASTTDEPTIRLFLARKDIHINARSRFKETALYQSIQRSRLPIAKLLLSADADPNLGNWEDQTPLAWAANAGKEEALTLLLQTPHIDINRAQANGKSPLSLASSNAHTKCVKLLLAHNADIKSADKEGNTALSLATAAGHKIVVKFLIKSGADPNIQNQKGNTPLALAAANNHEAVVRFLLENGADPELADEDEETPLEKARDGRMEGIVNIFKEVLKI